MRTLRHPYITPHTEIDVEDDRVPAYVSAGWLLTDDDETPEVEVEVEEPTTTTPDPEPTGEDHDSEESM